MAAVVRLYAVRLVFLAGAVAAIAGIDLLLLERPTAFAAAASAGGLALVAWVIAHPARRE